MYFVNYSIFFELDSNFLLTFFFTGIILSLHYRTRFEKEGGFIWS